MMNEMLDLFLRACECEEFENLASYGEDCAHVAAFYAAICQKLGAVLK